MTKTWASFEEKIRDIATLIWGRRPQAEKLGEAAIDGVLHIDPQLSILIEITEERNLGKIRTDVAKLVTAQNYLYSKHIIARCFCVVDAESVTEGMVGAGAAQNIRVMTSSDFSKLFFDFQTYKATRSQAPFGSAVDPLTGEKDDTEYVPVKYTIEASGEEIGTREIATYLREGWHIILLGEYGSGKSRCVRETFRYLADHPWNGLSHPIAIDLRDAWGMRRGVELIQRHMGDLGLDHLTDQAVRAMNAGAITFLLDGFDELGSQAWNNDPAKLRAIRAHALQGVKDTVQRSKAGVLISGREHYFPSTEEMYQATGVDPKKTLVVRSRDEFTDDELDEFFEQRGIDLDIPVWLPRRPLICQTINNLPEADREEMFNAGASETAFWDHFMRVLCVRDARIHVTFDPDTIYRVLLSLARTTRTRNANVGPLSLADMQRAFEEGVGQSPGEEASVMLQRLPSLGRLGKESEERQFTDMYILDGLRAKDVATLALSSVDAGSDVLSTSWSNPLDQLGLRILASDSRCSDARLLKLAEKASESANKVLAADAVAALATRTQGEIDFEGLDLKEAQFIRLDLSNRVVTRLSLSDCIIGYLTLPTETLKKVKITASLAERVYGATSAKGLPDWLQIQADSFDSVDNTASIRRIGVKPAHQMLLTIVRKTFFQKGAGRKEEALTRGFGKLGSPGLIGKVLNLLQREGILEKAKGNEGWLYIPVRKHTGRMEKMLAELNSSQDPIWAAMNDLK